MTEKRKRRPVGAGGAWGEHTGGGAHRQYTAAWRQWATRADCRRMSARQAVAVALLQAGITEAPEQALAVLAGGRDG